MSSQDPEQPDPNDDGPPQPAPEPAAGDNPPPPPDSDIDTPPAEQVAPPGLETQPPTGDTHTAGGSRRTAVIVAAAALIVVAVVVAVVVIISTKSDEPSGPLPDAAQLLKQSSDTTRKLHSAHLTIDIDKGLQDRIRIETLSGDLTNAPTLAARGTAKVESMAGKVDFVVFDGVLYGKLGANFLEVGPVKEVFDIERILNPDMGLANLLTSFIDPKSEELDTIDGVTVAMITGNVSKEAVDKIAPELKVKDAVPATVWIRTDGNHELVRVGLEAIEDNSITLTFSEWGKSVVVEKPPE